MVTRLSDFDFLRRVLSELRVGMEINAISLYAKLCGCRIVNRMDRGIMSTSMNLNVREIPWCREEL